MPRPIIATIFPHAIENNLRVAKLAAPCSQVWAVLKAQGYGHGIQNIYAGLTAADQVAVLDFEEAELLRTLGWSRPIVMLEGIFDSKDWQHAQALSLSCVVHSPWQLRLIQQNPAKYPMHLWLKLNSGMNRLGFNPKEFLSSYQELSLLPYVESIGCMTHFAMADSDAITEELALFKQTCQALTATLSSANSAAILQHPATHLGAVRCGVMLYGANPISASFVSAKTFGLIPAMQLTSEIIAIQELKKGDYVGYGAQFRAQKKMRIGIVACGYADGYLRSAKEGTPVWVNGVICSLVGRVSMDMLTVDISHAQQVQIGSTVELWGKHLSIDEVAAHSQTIAYELLCGVAPRVSRRVHNISSPTL